MDLELQQPRLTRFLKAFEDTQSTQEDVDLLYKIVSLIPESNKLNYNWRDLINDVRDSYGHQSPALKRLTKLKLLSAKLFDEPIPQKEEVQDAALLMLRAFLIRNSVSKGYLRFFKEYFGLDSCELIGDIRVVVKEIGEHITPRLRERLRTLTTRRTHWGERITYTEPEFWNPPEVDFEEFQLPSIADTFSMAYKPPPQQLKPTSQTSRTKNWLRQELDRYFREENYFGMTRDELEHSIICIISKPKSTDELQNELYDYLGYDKFDLVRDIIMNRKIILRKKLKKILAPGKHEAETVPTVNSVKVMTEYEIENEKRIRKDEKRLSRLINGKSVQDVSSDEEDFKPAELRMKRIAELTDNANKWFMGLGDASGSSSK